MILIDTSVWIDHLRSADTDLDQLLAKNRALMHPFVIGEIALGQWSDRAPILVSLQQLPQAPLAYDDEVLRLIEADELAGAGIGYVDAHLIASTRLTSGASLWTRDKRLLAVAHRLHLAAPLSAKPTRQ